VTTRLEAAIISARIDDLMVEGVDNLAEAVRLVVGLHDRVPELVRPRHRSPPGVSMTSRRTPLTSDATPPRRNSPRFLRRSARLLEGPAVLSSGLLPAILDEEGDVLGVDEKPVLDVGDVDVAVRGQEFFGFAGEVDHPAVRSRSHGPLHPGEVAQLEGQQP